MDRLPFKKLHEPRDGRILEVPPRFKIGGEAGFPLPSTGRGIEGEGWADQAAFPITKHLGIPTPHPGPLPVEGRGRWQRVSVLRGASSFTTVVLPRCARFGVSIIVPRLRAPDVTIGTSPYLKFARTKA